MVKHEQPAVFLDRDGVLNEDLGYVYRPEDLKLRPGVVHGLSVLKKAGFKLIVITNQSGIARGYFTESDVINFHETLNEAIKSEGGPSLDAFYICPHHLEGTDPRFTQSCSCRKPEPGMVLAAQIAHDLYLANSYLIGDKSDDMECAVRAGVQGIQVVGRYPATHPKALAVVSSFQSAVQVILADVASRESA
jgi:D-glycero-D-manno-heptose 1,7-bisphosphate phosphatase